MQSLNWPHTLQQTIAKLWLKAIPSVSLQTWLCCNSAALHFQHSSPYAVLNVCLNRVPKQLPVNTDSENVFQSNILSKNLQSYDCVSRGRPPSFYEDGHLRTAQSSHLQRVLLPGCLQDSSTQQAGPLSASQGDGGISRNMSGPAVKADSHLQVTPVTDVYRHIAAAPLILCPARCPLCTKPAPVSPPAHWRCLCSLQRSRL